ncbi:MAG TPA: hypothetical protein VI389_00660 [Geobacteraceae bacterium]
MSQDEMKDQMPLFGGMVIQQQRNDRQSPSETSTAPRPPKTHRAKPAAPPPPAPKKVTPAPKTAPTSGLVPAGDVRLTANIREDLHLLLKITAAKRRTTIGELIEELVEAHLA